MDKKIEEMGFEELLEEIHKDNPETVNEAKKMLYDKYLKRLEQEEMEEKFSWFIVALVYLVIVILICFIIRVIGG